MMSDNPLNLPEMQQSRSDWRGKLLLLACKLLGFPTKGMVIMSKSRGTVEALMIARCEDGIAAMVHGCVHTAQQVAAERFLRDIMQSAAQPEPETFSDEGTWAVEPDETVH